MLEKVVEAIDAELGRQEMVLTDPLTLRRMMATRAARAALEAMREPSLYDPDNSLGAAMCWDDDLANEWDQALTAILTGEA